MNHFQIVGCEADAGSDLSNTTHFKFGSFVLYITRGLEMSRLVANSMSMEHILVYLVNKSSCLGPGGSTTSRQI